MPPPPARAEGLFTPRVGEAGRGAVNAARFTISYERVCGMRGPKKAAH